MKALLRRLRKKMANRATTQLKSALLSDQLSSADWSFRDANTDYLTHGVHRYSGKFIPQIAAQAIELLTRPGDLIVDPYCGSGTTLVEAASHSRKSIGVDLNPLAVLISTVKTTPVEDSKLKSLLKHFTEFAIGIETHDLFHKAPHIIDDVHLNDPWFTKWFQAPVLLDLVVLNNEIQRIDDTRLRNVALVAFSDVLRRSSNAHQGYPNVMFDRKGGLRPRPGRFFIKSLKQTCAAVSSLNKLDSWMAPFVIEGDAKDLPIADCTVDAVISHPPYVGSIPYAEYGALSLKWLGSDPKHIDRILTGGRRQTNDVVDRFSADYARMIISCFRVIKEGGYLFLQVGNPTVKGRIIDLAEMTNSHALAAGFVQFATTTRSAENRRANKMGDETIVVFRKI
jgi:methylase of polypeptide subunit release factors